MSADKKVNLLLIGRTGNGKSSTGNSIFGDKVFTASMNSQPFTEKDIVQETKTFEGTQITVVDGPGIGDASLNDPKDVEQTIQLTEKAIEFCSDGFNAVLLVLRYGDRFTRQEKDAVHMVKGILGDKVLQKHGVVVLTRGDSFENDFEEDGVRFEKWCLQQTGDFAELFQECKQRFVLFNNRTKDPDKLHQQRRELLAKVQMCKPYTVENYEDAKEHQHRLVVSSKHDIMQQKNKELIDHINADIDKLDVTSSPDDAIKKLTELESKLSEHRRELKEETAGTDVGTHLLNQLTLVEFTVTSKKNLAESYRKLQEAKNDARTRGTQQLTSGKRPKSGKEVRKLPPRDNHNSGPGNYTSGENSQQEVRKLPPKDNHNSGSGNYKSGENSQQEVRKLPPRDNHNSGPGNYTSGENSQQGNQPQPVHTESWALVNERQGSNISDCPRESKKKRIHVSTKRNARTTQSSQRTLPENDGRNKQQIVDEDKQSGSCGCTVS